MMLTLAELQNALQAPVYMHETEAPVLAQYASLSQAPIVEIGTGYGGSAMLFLMASHQLIFSVDNYTGDSMGKWHTTHQQVYRLIRVALKRMDQLASMDRLTLIDASSATLAALWADPIGLLYIDGDHRYEAVKADFEAWIPFVQPGGYVLLHDSRRLPDAPDPTTFARGWQGPTRLAQELQTDKRVRLEQEAYSLTVWSVS